MVPGALVLAPFKNVPIDTVIYMYYASDKWPCPWKTEIPGLLYMSMHKHDITMYATMYMVSVLYSISFYNLGMVHVPIINVYNAELQWSILWYFTSC